MKKNISLVVLTAISLGACATKGYQIAAPLSNTMASSMTCRELNLELAEVNEVEVAINQEAKTDIRSVGAFLMDFGIGNSMAKNRAEEALAERRSSITSALAAKGCGSQPTEPVKTMDEEKS